MSGPPRGKSSDALQGHPQTSPGQSELASAMQRRPGSMGGAVLEALKGATQSHAMLFRPFRAEINFLGRVLGRRCAVPQADLWLPLRGEEELHSPIQHATGRSSARGISARTLV